MTFRITASISDLVIAFKGKAMFNRFLQGYGKKEKAILQALIASLFITGMLASWRQFGTTLEFLELYSRDWMFQFKKDAPSDSRFLIVGITEKDIQTYGYPIPDKTIAELLTTLNQGNPQTIGLDIIRDVPLGGGQAEQAQLINVLQQQPSTFVVCRVGTDVDPGYPPPPEISKFQVGISNLPVDTGGIIRRGLLGVVPPPLPDQDADNLCQDPTEPLFSLGFQTAQQYLANVGIAAEITAREEIKFGDVIIPPLVPTSGGYLQADTGGYQVLLQFPLGSQGPQQVTLTEALNKDIDQDLIQDRIIFIGYVAESVKDIYSTPFNSRRPTNLPMPGVVIHAQLASQLIGHVLDEQPLPWFLPDWVEILWIGAWALVGGLIAAFIRHPLMITASTLVMLGLCGGIALVSFSLGGWVILATPILAYGFTLTGVTLIDRYAQPVSKQIKEFLKIDIDIDQAKVKAQVKEIEESEAFETIKQASKRLREKRHSASTTSEAINQSEAPKAENSLPAESSETENPNSVQSLADEAAASSNEETSNNPNGADDYFDHLRQQGSQLKRRKNNRNEGNPNPDAD
jgi:CHASE2 domain-containing sensor protein